MPSETITKAPVVIPTSDPPGQLPALDEYEGVFQDIRDKKDPVEKVKAIHERKPTELPKAGAVQGADNGIPVAPGKAEPAPPGTEDPETEGWTEKGKSSWKALKEKHSQEVEALKKQHEEASAELNKFRAQKPDAEIERLKKERDDLSERLRIVDIENHPKFKPYFDSKINRAITLAKNAVGSELAPQIERILQMPDSDHRTAALETLTEGLSPTRHAKLISAITELDSVQLEKADAVDRAKKDSLAWQEEQKAEAQRGQAQVAKVMEETLAQVKDGQKGLATFQKREGDEEWNRGVEHREELAKRIYSGSLPWPDLAKAAIWAASAPELAKSASALAQENKKLKEEIASLKVATPAPQNGQASAPASDRKKYAGENAAIDATMDEMVKAGLLR